VYPTSRYIGIGRNVCILLVDFIERTVTAKVLTSRKRREGRQEKASRSENEPYLFRIKSAPGGNRTHELALTRLALVGLYFREMISVDGG
jgi:hypothetical protein